MPYTFGDLKAELRPILWPQGEADRLVVPHNKFFEEALIEIQRWVDCLQYNNTQIFRACSRFYHCGLTVMEQPVSLADARSIGNRIVSVSVIDKINPSTKLEDPNSPDDWCSRIYYQPTSYVNLTQYQQQVKSCSTCGTGLAEIDFGGIFGFPFYNCGKGRFPVPDDAEYLASPGLPMGYHYQPQSSTNSKWGRSKQGVWAVERGRLYLAPWLQGSETAIVEWDGIKNIWDDLDLVENNATLKRAVRYYVAWNDARDYLQDDVAAARAQDNYMQALRGLMRDCRDETMPRERAQSNARQAVLPAESIYVSPVPTQLNNQSSCPDIPAPTFNPPAGSAIAMPSMVAILNTMTGVDIYYTVDGSEPSRASFKYTGPTTFTNPSNLKAVAFLGECSSPVASASYVDASTKSINGLKLTTLCTTTDRSGPWFVFTPNLDPDENWNVSFDLSGSKVKRLEMYETDETGAWTTGRCWSTDYTIYPAELSGKPFNSYPLVIVDGVSGTQLNTHYTSNLNLGSGSTSWNLFGDSVGVPQSGKFYILKIILEDGSSVFCTHSIHCDHNDHNTCLVLYGYTNNETAVFSNQGSDPGVNVVVTFGYDRSSNKWIFGSLTGATLSPGTSFSPGDSFDPSTPVPDGIIVTGEDGVSYQVCGDFPNEPPCSDGYGLTIAVDIQINIKTYRASGLAVPTCVCEGNVPEVCSEPDNTGACVTEVNGSIASLSRTECGGIFYGTVVITGCSERPQDGGVGVFTINAQFDPVTGEFGFETPCNVIPPATAPFVLVSGDEPCDSGLSGGLRCTISCATAPTKE